MTILEIALIVFAVIAVLGFALYMLNRWASKKMVEQDKMIAHSKTPATIYVIDKKKAKMDAAHFPKAVTEQMPKWQRFMKVPLVKAKVGPQIITLMCDKRVFAALPVKKMVKVELAGIYIVSMKGMKTKQEIADLRRTRQSEDGTLPWYRKLTKR